MRTLQRSYCLVFGLCLVCVFNLSHAHASPKLGFDVAHRNGDIVITSVDRDVDLRVNDVIIEVNHTPIFSELDYLTLVDALHAGGRHSLLLLIERDGSQGFFDISFIADAPRTTLPDDNAISAGADAMNSGNIYDGIVYTRVAANDATLATNNTPTILYNLCFGFTAILSDDVSKKFLKTDNSPQNRRAAQHHCTIAANIETPFNYTLILSLQGDIQTYSGNMAGALDYYRNALRHAKASSNPDNGLISALISRISALSKLLDEQAVTENRTSTNAPTQRVNTKSLSDAEILAIVLGLAVLGLFLYRMRRKPAPTDTTDTDTARRPVDDTLTAKATPPNEALAPEPSETEVPTINAPAPPPTKRDLKQRIFWLRMLQLGLFPAAFVLTFIVSAGTGNQTLAIIILLSGFGGVFVVGARINAIRPNEPEPSEKDLLEAEKPPLSTANSQDAHTNIPEVPHSAITSSPPTDDDRIDIGSSSPSMLVKPKVSNKIKTDIIPLNDRPISQPAIGFMCLVFAYKIVAATIHQHSDDFSTTFTLIYLSIFMGNVFFGYIIYLISSAMYLYMMYLIFFTRKDSARDKLVNLLIVQFVLSILGMFISMVPTSLFDVGLGLLIEMAATKLRIWSGILYVIAVPIWIFATSLWIYNVKKM